MTALPTLFLPHGGGPCFFMEWTHGPRDTWHRMESWLRQLGASLGETPRAVIVVSAHWEAPVFTLTSGEGLPLIYDYYGFPEHTYRLTYGVPGAPWLAQQVHALLTQAGMAASLDAQRGYDHGVFIPFKLIYPEANVPLIQLSLRHDLDPKAHLEVGRALAGLREQGVLIVGSGMSYHNLRASPAVHRQASDEFDRWLTEAATASPEKRDAALQDWAKAPKARLSHPREEHLLPLMVVAGAAGEDVGEKIFTDRVMEMTVSAFQFGRTSS